jgi:hypothetical protein
MSVAVDHPSNYPSTRFPPHPKKPGCPKLSGEVSYAHTGDNLAIPANVVIGATECVRCPYSAVSIEVTSFTADIYMTQNTCNDLMDLID